MIFLFILFKLIHAGQAHESLASIVSLSVALQQLVLSKHCQWLVRLQTSQVYMSLKGGERSEDSSPRW